MTRSGERAPPRAGRAQANVRRVKDSVSIEDLADDIARRGLLQSLTVRPIRQEDGTETGTFEVPVGGRRYRALERLVKQKRMTKTAPVPCIVHDDGLAEEDSLAENARWTWRRLMILLGTANYASISSFRIPEGLWHGADFNLKSSYS